MAAADSVRDYGLAVPHGPNLTGEHVATADIPENPGLMTAKEQSVLNSIIYPSDIYTEDGVYWADLPIGQRIAFVNKVNNAEARKELIAIGRTIKADPLAPVGYYLKNMVLPGAGLLLEGYVLFSIGNIKPLFQAVFKSCWKTYQVCDKTWIQAVDYLEVSGIIIGKSNTTFLFSRMFFFLTICQVKF